MMFFGIEFFFSGTGIKQGDPMGPAPFAIGLDTISAKYRHRGNKIVPAVHHTVVGAPISNHVLTEVLE